MIDLHCHLLPGVDDGALDLRDSVAMARIAATDGVTEICATPHVRHDHDTRLPEIGARVAEVQDALDAAGVPVRVRTGAEVAETALEGITDAELALASLGGSGRWVLLEPRAGPLSGHLGAAVDRLAARGYRALIAHPERHLAADLHARLTRLVARGALVQATAAMFEHPRAADAMRDLARRGLVHVLASDAHSSHGGRRPVLAAAFASVARVLDAAAVAWMRDTAPAAIVAGADVEPPYAPS